MNSHYFKTGNTVNIESSDALEVLDYLPVATYVVKKNEMTGNLFLQTTNDFDLPAKIYGNPHERADRIVRTFNSRKRSTGVLLSGDKGSGKTMLTKLVARMLMEEKVPVIVVNEPWCGPVFNELIGKITQPAVVIFDEFDKVYDEDEQQMLLTLLDGTVETKKLFILTTNSGHIDSHLINRPGRIYYRYHYAGLDEDFVREYAQDTLNNKDNIESLVNVCNTFTSMTFDMLQAMIEEMNRWDESAVDVMSCLNVDITAETSSYSVNIMFNGSPITNAHYPYRVNSNPLFNAHAQSVEVVQLDGKTFNSKQELPELELSKSNLMKITKGGTLMFGYKVKTDNDLVVVLEKQDRSTFDWGAF